MVFDNKRQLVTIYIENKPYQVDPDDNLLAGVLSKQLNLPYFCWHPAMGSVGACRQCAVIQYQDENDQQGRIIMSCMTRVVDGMRISLQDAQASEFREQVIAAMMTNHPHDCPVCAEGGECHLQDMTVMTGHSQRQFKGKKRTFENQYLGELVGHEMNRCITCYRCVRFYKDYAGGEDFDVFGSKNQVYFGRQTDGVLESEFSGNLVEVCPTGVFTNKLFSAHYARKWDLQSAPSICVHCSVGCNTSIGERYGSVRRVVNRFNSELNGYFLCDRGRFGIGFVNSEQRITAIQASREHQGEPVDHEILSTSQVLTRIGQLKGHTFIGVGSGRASLEANVYLQHLVGQSAFSLGLNAAEMAVAAQHKALLHRYSAPSLAAIEQCDLVIVIGEDISQTSPRVALAVRQALRNSSFDQAKLAGIPIWQDEAVRTLANGLLAPLFSLHSTATKLDKVSRQALVISPKEINQCLTMFNEQLCLSLTGEYSHNTQTKDLGIFEVFIRDVINAFSSAKKTLIVTGYSQVSSELLANIEQLMALLHSDAFTRHYPKIVSSQLVVLPKECNSVGALSLIDEQTLSCEQLLLRLEQEQLLGVILLEQELAGFTAKQRDKLSKYASRIIVLEHSESQLTAMADYVLPVAAVTEGSGHYVNYQGVAQAYYQVHLPRFPIRDSWQWLALIAERLTETEANFSGDCLSLQQLHQYFNKHCVSWPWQGETLSLVKSIARQPHRASGRTAQMANISMHEVQTVQLPDDHFSFSMEGLRLDPLQDMPFIWAPGWNSNQAINKSPLGANPKRANEDKLSLSFPCAEKLIDKWTTLPTIADGEEKKSINSLLFVPQASWHQMDWQASFVPEFSLLHKGNSISIARDYVHQQGWHAGQFLQLDFELAGENHTMIAMIYCVDYLPVGNAYGQLFGISTYTLPFTVSLSVAELESIEAYKHQENVRCIQANKRKNKILNRLKLMDQTIPIHICSGEFDDV